MFGSSNKHDQVFYNHFDEHIRCSAEAARLLVNCLEGHSAPDKTHSDIRTLLDRAIKVDREVQAEARKTWITPFDGWDIRELSNRMAVLMRHIEAGAERVTAYGLCNGAVAPHEALELGNFVLNACRELQAAVHDLSNKHADDEILRRVEAVQKLEHDSDRLYRRALAALFDGKSPAPVRSGFDREPSAEDHEPAQNADSSNGHGRPESMQAVLSVIKWHELYDKLEQATNACRDVANELESIVAEHA